MLRTGSAVYITLPNAREDYDPPTVRLPGVVVSEPYEGTFTRPSGAVVRTQRVSVVTLRTSVDGRQYLAHSEEGVRFLSLRRTSDPALLIGGLDRDANGRAVPPQVLQAWAADDLAEWQALRAAQRARGQTQPQTEPPAAPVRPAQQGAAA
jgi:hypothetical protein